MPKDTEQDVRAGRTAKQQDETELNGKTGLAAKQDDQSKAKAKRAAQKKKEERRERRAMRRHKRWFAFLHWSLTGFFVRKFGYTYDSLADVEGPYLLLANHNMELDPALVGIATKKQLYFVASEHVMRKGFLTRLLMHIFRPIIHTKGKTGTKSAMEIIKTLKKGSNVCLFAEGNRSFNGVTGEIPPATGKLAKAAGASLITYRFEGGFLSQPRFSVKARKGRIIGHLVHIYKPEELKAMSDEQMNEAIQRDLYEDAYAVQDEKMIPYEGKKLTLGIESTLFYCPVCRRFNSLHSTDDEVRCECGFTASYDRFGYLNCSDGVKRNLRDWDAEQKAALKKRYEEKQLEPFTDTVSIRLIGSNHRPGKQYWYEITATSEGVHALLVDEGKTNRRRLVSPASDRKPYERYLKPEDLFGLAVYSRNSVNLILEENNEQFDIKGDIGFNALKYRYLYEFVKESGKI